MTRDINLNSADWCNLVFEGKNKTYGAYEMRQTSSKRHLIAFGFTILFVSLIVLIPQFLNAVSPTNDIAAGSYDGPAVLANLTEPEDEPEVIAPVDATPPPPPLIRSDAFTPPLITDDSEVTPENEMRDQLDLMESTGVISVQTVDTYNTVGVDIADVLREQRDIASTGTGTEPTGIFEHVEVMPKFMGGDSELMRFLSSNLRYPPAAIENEIEGRVIVKFVVGKTGNISDIQILKGIDPSCDKEAVRVVKSMPNWVPGMQNGNAVAVYFTLPILFRLQR